MEKLAKIIQGFKGKEILLLGHKNADPDSFCSAFALFEGLKKLNIKTRIGAVESVKALSRKIAPENLKVEINPKLDSDAIILLDMSTQGQLGNFFKTFESSKAYKILIDHHPAKERIKADYSFVDEAASTTVELVYELLNKLKIPISKRTASALLFGMTAETAHLRYAKTKNFKIIFDLLKNHGMEFSDILKMLNTPLALSERIARLKAAKRTKVHRISNYLIVTSEVGSFEASAARSLIYTGADLAAVYSKKKNEIRISLRASSDFYNQTGICIGKGLIQEIAKILGGTGSGHPTAAGANGPKTEKINDALKHLIGYVQSKTASSI